MAIDQVPEAVSTTRWESDDSAFRALLDAGIIGVLESTSERILRANDRFLELVGRTQDDLAAGRISWQDLTPPDQVAASAAAVAELRGRGIVTPFEKDYVRPDGTRVPVLLGAAVVERNPLRWISFVIDLSERRAIEERHRYTSEQAVRLERVSGALSASSSPADIAHVLIEVALPSLGAHAGGLALRDDAAGMVEFASLAGVPEKIAHAHRAVALDSDNPIAESARTGEAVYLGSSDAMRSRYPRTGGDLLDSGAALAVVPLVRDSRPIGVITLSFAEERTFPADERATIETLARVCSQALDRARLFGDAEDARRSAQASAEAERAARQSVQRLSDSLQRALLPTLSVKGRGLRVTAYYRAGERRLTLGGDFYDCIELPDSTVALLVGDVSGHGAAAAAVGASMRAAWRAYALDGLAPHVVLERLDTVFAYERPDDEMFATACSARLSADRARVEVSLAGHPAPMLVGERVVTPRLSADLPLGTPEHAPRRVHTVAVGQAHSLLLYTDGLIEGRSTPTGRQRFGAERLRRAVALRASALDGAGLESIVRQAELANGGPLADDVALVTLRFGMRTPRGSRT